MNEADRWLLRAREIDEARAATLLGELGASPGAALGVLLGVAFPPLRPAHGWQFDALTTLCGRRLRGTLPRRALLAEPPFGGAGDRGDAVGRALRRAVWSERARIALREILPRSLGGAPIDAMARDLSRLASGALEVAFAEARAHVTGRLGEPRRASGEPSTLVVFGLGKLGGGELNAGSDVDVVLLYDTDEGQAGGSTLHEYWTLVARRAVTMLETPTEDGFVWRVDLRLRPEGSRGPLVYSAAAAERYYETWGRLWERVALLRARPVAGDLALGVRIQRAVIEPFVYRRAVEPSVATHLAELLRRSRLEARVDDALDLKLGRGGIREAEFFVQALQLVWGGREPSLRVTGTLSALARLESRGLVSDREARDVARAYRLLRRAEHVVQNRAGIQTHSLPRGGAELGAVARILGFASDTALGAALESSRAAVTECFASTQAELLRPAPRYTALLAELEQGGSGVWVAAREHFGDADVEEHLRALARRPDSLLGSLTRERHPVLVDRVLDALCASADPEAAARYLRSFLARVSSTGAYVAALAEDARAAKRLVTVLGASALVGDAIAARPDLVDVVLSRSEVVTVAAARRTVDQELELAAPELLAVRDPSERRDALIGALRRAQWRVTLDVAVADLAGEIGTRDVTRILSALAERILQRAVEIAAPEGDARGLAVIAVGKLGGAEVGYGSDLDVLFVYDPASAPAGADPEDHFTRLAQRTLRVLGESHALGQGYELDTRLRPSGAQGLLVTSLRAFARYHRCEDPAEGGDPPPPGVLSSGAAWERQALLRARAVAGDAAVGAAVERVAARAAYERGAPDPGELHHLRLRLERELGRERPGRWDLKTGRGGLFDVEFAAQWLQMRCGSDPRVRTTETLAALQSLHDAGHLPRAPFEALRDGYLFLRRLEQRLRVVHGSADTVLDARSPGLEKLARRLGVAAAPGLGEAESLLDEYQDVTEQVRAAYLGVLGLTDAARPPERPPPAPGLL